MSEWRYLASRLNGDGTETFLDDDLPLQDVEVVTTLSGADSLDFKVIPEVADLKKNGQSIFLPWSTAVYAEQGGVIRGGAIVCDMKESGQTIQGETIGFAGYPNGMPYNGDKVFRNEDPLNVFRHIWQHLQAFTDGDLGVTVDTTRSNARVGVSQNVVDIALNGNSSNDQALVYGWWQTLDLGNEIANLATNTPFDYRMSLAWDTSGTTKKFVKKHIQLGAPRIGTRRQNLRFMVGENIFVQPEIIFDGDDYASDIWAFGAGEGRAMVKNLSQRNDIGRLRRVAVVQDKSLRTTQEVYGLAYREKTKRTAAQNISQVVVHNHPHARLGSYNVGDEILIQSETGWSSGLYMWVRILQIKLNPETEVCTLDVIQSDKAT